MPRAAKPAKKQGLNYYVIGAFLAFLAVLTVFIYYPSYQEEPLPTPYVSQEPLVRQNWMAYMNKEVNKFKFINASAIAAVSGESQPFPRGDLISLSKPALNITVGDAEFVLELEYPQVETTLIVNVIRLKPHIAEGVEKALVSIGTPVFSSGNASIFAVMPLESKTLAHMALNGDELLYSESGSAGLNKLQKTIESYLNHKSSPLDSDSILKGMRIARSIGGERLGISLTMFGEGAKGANFVWRLLSFQENSIISLQAVGYEDVEAASSNLENAKTLFFSSNEKVIQVENFLVGLRRQKIDELKPSILAL